MKFSTQAKQHLWNLAPAIFTALRRTSNEVEFSIGVVSGPDIHTLRDSINDVTPVLSRSSVTDVPAAFVADPFIIEIRNLYYMFFEIMNRLDYLGCIGCATSTDQSNWHYRGVVLNEPFHLAYPHVFYHEENVFMIPDSIGTGVRLYRADRFPDTWQFEKTLIDNPALCDCSVFQYEDHWWAFCCESIDGRDALRIYYADTLHSPWREHAAGRIVEPADQRPAGRVVEVNGNIFRFVQNQQGEYAEYARMRRVVKLTPTEFLEDEDIDSPLLRGSGTGWNADGMHHIDLHCNGGTAFFACVDGVRRH